MFRHLPAIALAILLPTAALAAAAQTQLPVKDANGVTRNMQVLSSTGAVGGNLSSTNMLVDSAQAEVIGAVTASPAANTVLDRLKTIATTLGSPFQAGGSIGNSSFGISGTLPAFASTPTVNLGTLNGAATAAKQPALGTAGSASADVISVQGIASGTALNVSCSSGCGGSGGTASNFAATFPTAGTAIGAKSGANMVNLTADGSGNLNVNVAAGSASNAAASATGSAVPASADYGGVNVGGTLRGRTAVNPSGSIYAASSDVSSIAGTTAAVNSGNKDGGTLRVVIATDQPALTNALKVDGSAVTQPVSGTVSITANSAVNVAQINGVTPLMGAGATGTGSPRVTIASDNAPLSTVGPQAAITATPTVSTSAYASGDVIGTKMTLANFARASGGAGLLQSVLINSKSSQTGAIDVVIFSADPSSSTFTDNAALALNAGDFAKVAAVIHVTDWTSLGTPSTAQGQNAAAPIVLTGTSAYAVMVARSTPTLASTSDLSVTFNVLQQ